MLSAARIAEGHKYCHYRILKVCQFAFISVMRLFEHSAPLGRRRFSSCAVADKSAAHNGWEGERLRMQALALHPLMSLHDVSLLFVCIVKYFKDFLEFY